MGGTWFWNRYPGAECDVESFEYSYSFSEELQDQWVWEHRYVPQAEILRYADHVADRFDLRRFITFDTRVVSMHHDDAHARWVVTTSRGERVVARFCVMASGNLSTPRLPDVPGIERFEGEWHHAARWPADGVDVAGKRVAVIGTGSTGIQMIPVVARDVAHLVVFQRHPNYCVPARNTPIDEATDRARKATYPEKREAARNSLLGISLIDPPTKSTLEVSDEEREARFEEMWYQGSNQGMLLSFTDLMRNQEANDLASDFARRKIRAIVEDPEVAELLCPKDYPIGAKRLCVGTDYYETFNRPNVTLVDALTNPIEEITPTGVRSGGTTYEVDTILFATGFDAMTGAVREIDIRGRDGVALQDRWVAGPTTYLGIMVAELPNLFLITGPGSPSVKSNMILSIEQHVDWIADCLAFLRAEGVQAIEPTAEAEATWVGHVNEVANATLYVKADSWYTGANVPGKPRVFMPYVGGISVYRRICDEVAADGYRGFHLTPAPEGTTALSAAEQPSAG